jgi:hypothetical protein
MSKALEEFKELMQKSAKNQVPIQTEWCEVKEVDWNDKTMTATSLLNGLEYFDVLLGLGSIFRKPKVGTKVLVGMIANKEACFLIDCEAFEEMTIVSEKSLFTIKEEGFIVKQKDESLRVVLNDLIEKINDQNKEMQKLNQELQKVVVSIGVTPNVPALQLIVQNLIQIVQENGNIKQRLNSIIIE